MKGILQGSVYGKLAADFDALVRRNHEQFQANHPRLAALLDDPLIQVAIGTTAGGIAVGGLPATGGRLSPSVSPSEVVGRTPSEIDQLARTRGLVPRGPAPAQGRGAYVDPVTGQQRVLCHPNACPPHAHVNNPAGERLNAQGDVVAPESRAAHLPIKVE